MMRIVTLMMMIIIDYNQSLFVLSVLQNVEFVVLERSQVK